jgi:cytochrome c oxidase subunit II
LADLSAGKPHVVAPKGMGPYFWTYTAVLTIFNVIIAGWILFGPMPWLMPGWNNAATDRAADVDALFKFMSVFGNAIFFYVAGYVIYFCVVFRRRSKESPSTIGVQIHDAPTLEFWWTYFPVILLGALVVMSVWIWGKIFFPTVAPALTMEVVGHQFFFEFRYPGFKESLVSPKDEMVLPVGRPVRILLSSSDVLHQFWVPDFRLKLATVPGLVQDMNFTPLRTGTYDIVCSEYCGLLHSHMQAKVVVEAQDVFDKWYSTHKSESAAATNSSIPLASGTAPAGQTLFNQKCTACHAIAPFDHKVVGPGLDKITNDPAHPNLVDGKPPTPANIANIIENGYTGSIGTMPNSQANGLAPKDVADLTAYLVSLK